MSSSGVSRQVGPGTSRRAIGGRASWIFADQALSSLSNAALMIVVARSVSPDEYGAFALAFSAYAFTVGLVQSLPGQILMIRYSARLVAGDQEGSRCATGTALWLAAIAVALIVPASLLVSGPLRASLLATAVVIPGLLLQEIWRIHFIASAQPKLAFVNDLVWVTLQAIFIVVLMRVGFDAAWSFVLAWGAAAGGAALLGYLQTRLSPNPRAAFRWLRAEGDVGWPSLLNSIVTLGLAQLALVGVAFVSSLAVVGAMRAAQTLLGPLNIIGFAATAFAVPEISRRPRMSFRAYLLSAAVICLPLGLAATAWGSALTLLPDRVGVWLLGGSWAAAQEALFGLTLFTVAIAVTTGPNAVMRALGRPGMSLIGSLVLAPTLIGLSAFGALSGAGGAALGYAAAAALTIPVAWALLVTAVKRGPKPRGGLLPNQEILV